MKVIELSANLGQELPYIVGLQTELPFGKRDLAQLAKNTKVFRCAQIGFDQGSRVVIPRKSSPFGEPQSSQNGIRKGFSRVPPPKPLDTHPWDPKKKPIIV